MQTQVKDRFMNIKLGNKLAGTLETSLPRNANSTDQHALPSLTEKEKRKKKTQNQLKPLTSPQACLKDMSINFR